MASNLSKFFKDRQVIILLIFLIVSILSISLLGVEQGLDLKGGSSIQLELEHPVNQSTMDVTRFKSIHIVVVFPAPFLPKRP